MKKLLFALLLVLAVLSLSACDGNGQNTTYSNLTYQDYAISIKHDETLFIFTNGNGEKTVLYDSSQNSQYINNLVKGNKYNIVVSVDNNVQWGNRIKVISNSN